MGTKILATQRRSSKTSGRPFCTFPLWNCEGEGQRDSIYERCHPVYSGECQQSIGKEWVAREAACKLMLYFQQSVFSKLKKWMGRRGIVEGQEEIARVTPPLRLAISRHPQ